MKNKDFHEEEEYRIVLTPHSDTSSFDFKSGATATRNYRDSGVAICEHFELAFPERFFNPNEIIHAIVLGPKNTSNISAVAHMFADRGFTQVTIGKSTATFR